MRDSQASPTYSPPAPNASATPSSAASAPVWHGNEVWLLAGSGTLYFAFPALYAASFSGFYLALMIVLWLLVLRGISIEFRNHIDSPLWMPFWDIVFGASSGLLALLYGVALGNVVRAFPSIPPAPSSSRLWTNFQPSPNTGIVDWYIREDRNRSVSA